MEVKIIVFIASLFLVGALLMHLGIRHKGLEQRQKSWIKYLSYLLITGLLVGSILFTKHGFFLSACLIIAMSLFELIRQMALTGKMMPSVVGILIMCTVAPFFILFSDLNPGLVLFTYLVTGIFDAFSQLTGQLAGKTKLARKISPNKTVEGLIGGMGCTLLLCSIPGKFSNLSSERCICLAIIISLAALCGDLLASAGKRRFGIKDYSHLLPGQGGFLDRFDSLLMSGAVVYIIQCIFA